MPGIARTKPETYALPGRRRREPGFCGGRASGTHYGAVLQFPWAAWGLLAAGLVVTAVTAVRIKTGVERIARHEIEAVDGKIRFNIEARNVDARLLSRRGAGWFDASETVLHTGPADEREIRSAAIPGRGYPPGRMADPGRGTLRGWQLSHEGQPLALQVNDGDVLPAVALPHDSQSGGAPAFRLAGIDSTGRRWTMRVTETGGLAAATDYSSVWYALIGGTITSLFLFWLVLWRQQSVRFYKERAETTEGLRASELRYRRLFESAKDGILILDADTGMIVDANPFLSELLGFSRADFLGKRVWELGFFKHLAANEEKFAELQAQEYVRYDDLPLETADGHVREVEFISNVYLADGKRVIQCNIRDITEWKRVETYRDMRQDILQILNEPQGPDECLRRVLACLKKGADVDAVGIRLQDGDDFPYFVQAGFPADFLQTENTLVERGKSGSVCRDDEGNICLECTCGLVLTGKTDPAHMLFTRGGSAWTNDSSLLLDIPPGEDPRNHPRNQCVHHGYASVALVPIRSTGRIVGLLQFNDRRKGRFSPESVALLEDIASHIGSALVRTSAEQALVLKTMLLEAQKEASPDGILAVDNEGHLLLFNTRFAEIWRIPRNVLDSKDDKTMRECISKQLQDPAGFNRSVAYLDEHKEEKSKDEVHFLDGRCFDRYSSPLADAAGDIQGRIWYFRDITDRKRAAEDEAKLSEQLRQAQKMEAVGRLAGGVAHDFNNMLMVIMGNAELCREQVEPDQPMREWLDQIMDAGKRSAETTGQLLAFARKQIVAPVILDLNDTIAGMLKLLRSLLGEDLKLTWRPGAGLRSIKIDPSQVDQILANLCVNARDAIAGVGEIILETGTTTVDAGYCASHGDAVPGTYVFLTVSDDGCGMDRETQAQIFEPFFTTKNIGRGTGLGLATVYGIVKQNNGFVHVYSEPGKGSTFKIYLPEAAAEIVKTSTAAQTEDSRGRGETILLVEDEKSVRMMCVLFLKSLGYRVLAAETPGEALKIAAERAANIDLLLTDVVMPGMDGRQLAQRIRALKPGVKVLFMSGYTADVIAQRGVLEQNVTFIGKPFTRDVFARKVREVLTMPGPAVAPTEERTRPRSPKGTEISGLVTR